MSTQEDFGLRPAFPTTAENDEGSAEQGVSVSAGMMLRQYAAIHLKVPKSGTDWLDDMIRESLRNEFRARALSGLIERATGAPRAGFDEFVEDSEQRFSEAVADDADAIATAMMRLTIE